MRHRSSRPFNTRSSTQPPSSYISGTSATLTNETFSQSGGIQQFIPWGGGQYSLSLDGGKATTSSIDSRFNPQLSSNLAASVTQPLLRNFGFDNIRQQIATTQNNQVIADLGLREQVAITTQAVRNTYFELIGAIEGQKVARQSLDLALASLKNNQTRVEVGTLAPDRHHRGRGRSRRERGEPDHRRGADQDDAGSAALAGA